ncbi:MAG TPA: amino acid adenylation domain-containing protein, partial [Candidatus Limnocylindrales bacterium]|nr:amino acid adenylation domain-containing protein [Candidatus Limnocylindrales bacterium]
MARTRHAALEAFRYRDLPVEALARVMEAGREPSRSPLFQVTIAVPEAPPPALVLGEVAARPEPLPTGSAKFDLSLAVVSDGRGLALDVEYAAELFDRVSLSRLGGSLARVLAAAVEAPDRPLERLRWLGAAERHQLLVEWNATARPVEPTTLDGLVAAQVDRVPDRIALVAGSDHLSFCELGRRAACIARGLVERGVGLEDRVGVLLERSPGMVVGLLGVLASGAAYVPLDPEYPVERLASTIADSGVRLVLAARASRARVPPGRAPVVEIEDLLEPALRRSPAAPVSPAAPSDGDRLAYVIYTSGSTGRPKGVMVRHSGVVNRLMWAQRVYPLTGEDTVLQKGAFSFDFSVWECFAPLVAGTRLVLATPDGHRDPAYLVDTIQREGVTLVHFVPSMLQVFLAAEGVARCTSLRFVFSGGEVLPPATVRRFNESVPARLRNQYGPTEITIDTTDWLCGPEERFAVPLGRPIDNARLYVVDEGLRPQAASICGELVIGGVGVARGYLGRPGLTAERFIPDPFGTTSGSRLYRTGDLARWLADGRLDFQGRSDDQLKVRGYRIEPAEVEAVLGPHPSVGAVAVGVLEDAAGARLAAWVTPAAGAEIDAAELRSFLGERLPSWMIPTRLFAVAEIPRTPSGKVDRRRLAGRGRPLGDESPFVAPESFSERLLTRVFAETLGLDRVGVEDDFFALGGHSLLATRVVAELGRVLGVEVPLGLVFEHPRVAELAPRLAALATAEAPPITRLPRSADLPLSFAQERLWLLDRLEPGNPAFNIPSAISLRGTLDRGALRRAFDDLVSRHESLRTRFVERDGEPRQCIEPAASVPLPTVDLGGLPAARASAERDRLVPEEARRRFDLARAPLLRAFSIATAPREHLLLLTVHHVASDGWSNALLARELTELYAARSEGRAADLPELSVQYADFACWQRARLQGEVLRGQVAYWRERLAGDLPALDLPTDRPRSARDSHRASRVVVDLPEVLSERVRAFSRARGVTLFVTLLSVLEVLLHRLSGQEDLIVGAPVAGRTRSEVEGVVGLFLNSLTLRCDLSGDPDFEEVVVRVREMVTGAYRHQDLPFERVLEEVGPDRDLAVTPLFQVFFNMLILPIPAPAAIRDLEVAPCELVEVAAKFDLTVYVRERPGGLRLDWVYRADLFDHARVREMADQYRILLERSLAEPRRPIREHGLVTERAARALLDLAERLQEAGRPPVHEVVREIARQVSDRTAVVDGEDVWTYAALGARAEGLARRLRGHGVGRGDIVAIHAERRADLVPAVLGALEAGAAFTVLDPAHPLEARAEILRAADPAGWIDLVGAEAGPGQAWQSLLDALPLRARLELRAGEPAVRAERDAGDPGDSDPLPVVGSEDLAYVAFTSGTTGKPKGILGRHGPLSHFVPWQARRFALGADDRYSMLSGLSHDPLQRDLFTPLQTGATLCIPSPGDMSTPRRLVEWIGRARVGVVHLTPAMGQLLATGAAGDDAEALGSLRRAFFVGEQLPRALVAELTAHAPRLECVNLYGTTETQRAVAFFPVPRAVALAGDGMLPLGRGMKDVQLLVLGPAGQLCGVGELGEICVRSPHLARGYLRDPAATAERFRPDPLGDGARVYHTGDLGRYLPGGEVAYTGRADRQVQVRGFRIEPAAIESVLRRHPAVREAAVLVEETGGGARLVGFVVGRSGEPPPAPDELLTFAGDWLPRHAVPARILVLESLPLTPNAKLDRRALLAASAAAAETHPERAGGPRGTVEELL